MIDSEGAVPTRMADAATSVHLGLWYPIVDLQFLGASGYFHVLLPHLEVSTANQGKIGLVPGFRDRAIAAAFVGFGHDPLFLSTSQVVKLVPPESAIAVDFGLATCAIVPFEIWMPEFQAESFLGVRSQAVSDWITSLLDLDISFLSGERHIGGG